MDFRRRLALWIYPDLGQEIIAAASVQCGGSPRVFRTAREVFQFDLANQLREIACIFEVYRGSALCWRDVKEARGLPMVGPLNYYEAYGVFSLLKRLKINPAAGCKKPLHDRALTLFSAFWPAYLEWPRDIPRPKPNKKEAA